MRQFLRSLGLVLLLWLVWYGVLFGSGETLGVETINKSFLRIAENFANVALVWGILHFFVMQLLLLLALALVIYWVSVGLTRWRGLTGWTAVVLAAVPPVLALQLLNSLFYPLSATAFPVALSWAQPLLLIALLVTVALVVLGALRSRPVAVQLLVFAVIVGIAYWPHGVSQARADVVGAGTDAKPNVIVLGIDAVRPSDLTYFGAKREVMPFLDKLLTRARVYTRDYTPIARTHAAWMAILTGLYPLHNGARFNLMESRYLDKKDLITHTLKQQGYRTVWGLDDRRFNDINDSYGFDQSVGPKMGAADFLITKFSDVPIVNVFANTRVGKDLFPHIYINRSNFITYVPFQFNSQLVGALDHQSPVFLAAHLCLPHYPFVSNLMKRITVKGDDVPPTYPDYLSMLQLADRQLKDLFGKLASGGYLNNAIVYVLSDHGEGFPGIDAPLKNGNPYAHFDGNKFGHGTSVLTITQYHNLLARLRFRNGRPVGETGRSDKLTSLVDVAPDIAAKLGITLNHKPDGEPLDKPDSHRHVILESSYSSSAISASRINQLKVLQQSANAYEVNKDGQLRLRPKLYKELDAAKQRAVVSSDGLMVALYPDEKKSAFVVDISKHTWWPSSGPIPAAEAGWRQDLRVLCDFYRKDPTFQNTQICRNNADNG